MEQFNCYIFNFYGSFAFSNSIHMHDFNNAGIQLSFCFYISNVYLTKLILGKQKYIFLLCRFLYTHIKITHIAESLIHGKCMRLRENNLNPYNNSSNTMIQNDLPYKSVPNTYY